jgi:ParB-like chromosome segregation protein Spo0J
MEIKQIPLSLVHPSPMNPRKTFEEEALQELADNIEKQGLLQPITVRPIQDKKRFEVIAGSADFHPEYEIVCGERRYRAVCLLREKYDNLDLVDENEEPYNPFLEISAIVRVMDDKEAFDAMITENLQRKDVDPIEEAFAFGQLIKNGNTAEDVAARFGKSIRFVQDRVKLNNLIPELMVAVRDGKCPIVAAMIISKLDEDAQRGYYKSNVDGYYGFTKDNAQNFVNNLFMMLDKSLWYQSDNQDDEDFEEGCGCKCSECPNNTANHGCLFYEMKPDGSGKCTNRTKFNSKTVAFQMSELDKLGDKLVKKGQPLEYGKAVVAITESSYESNDTKLLKEAIRTGVEERNLELVNPDSAFKGKCWYDADDERTIEMLQKGEVYRVIRLHDHMKALLNEEFYYVKDELAEDGSKAGLPIEVQSILDKYNSAKNGLQSSLSVNAAETLSKSDNISTEPLTDDEKVLMLSAMLANNFHLARLVGVEDYTNVNAIRDYVAVHPEKWEQIQHGWILIQIQERYQVLRMAEPILADLGKLHCPEEFEANQQKVRDKFNKQEAKWEKRLNELGYGLDGKPMVIREEHNYTDVMKQHKEMKKKFPDAILLFRQGDYYNIYEEDAVIAAPILKLTLTKSLGKKPVDTCGFVHSAIDKYLPKLVRAGKRVAICEQLKDPKK